MKKQSILTLAAIALLPLTALTQPPAPPSPPAPPAPAVPPGGPGDRGERDKRPKVPVTFLGVDTSPVPAVVCEQMNLAKGFGLVVDYVAPDSPAAAAGLQQNDILKMLNDQILMEPGQLAKLIRSYNEGTTVTLTILRKGQEQKLTVKLAKKEVPKGREFGPRGHEWMGDHDFGQLNDKIREMQEQFGGATEGVIQNAVMSAQSAVERVQEQAQQRREAAQRVREEAQRVREEAQRQRERAHEEAQRVSQQAREEAQRMAGQIKITAGNGLKQTRIDMGKAQIVFSDDKGELRLENMDGKKILTAKDPQGRLLFSGPVETKEDLDKVPAEVRQRFENLQQRDLPSVASSDDEEDNNPDADDNDDEGDDDSGASAQTISIQFVPQNFWAYRTILI
jgi:hypothetical protein